MPVVDRNHRLLGTVTIDDVIDVIHEEATEDIHRLGGVSADETIFDPTGKVVRRRLFWLLVNLPTAVLAATVVGLFEPSIQALAALAVFMPIVAGMGGNAGIQTFTVIVRAMALGDLTLANTRKVLLRRPLIGLANGVAAGTVAGLIAYFWKGDPLLGLILGVAMITNMLVAALAGTLVPVAPRSCSESTRRWRPASWSRPSRTARASCPSSASPRSFSASSGLLGRAGIGSIRGCARVHGQNSPLAGRDGA